MLHPRLITRELRPILSTLKLAYFQNSKISKFQNFKNFIPSRFEKIKKANDFYALKQPIGSFCASQLFKKISGRSTASSSIISPLNSWNRPLLQQFRIEKTLCNKGWCSNEGWWTVIVLWDLCLVQSLVNTILFILGR